MELRMNANLLRGVSVGLHSCRLQEFPGCRQPHLPVLRRQNPHRPARTNQPNLRGKPNKTVNIRTNLGDATRASWVFSARFASEIWWIFINIIIKCNNFPSLFERFNHMHAFVNEFIIMTRYDTCARHAMRITFSSVGIRKNKKKMIKTFGPSNAVLAQESVFVMDNSRMIHSYQHMDDDVAFSWILQVAGVHTYSA